MTIRKDDVVVLSPSFSGHESHAAPIWGGQFGYKSGVVLAAITHDHDASKHVARVQWSNGETNAFSEKDLMLATPDMLDVEKDMRLDIPLEDDICLLYFDGKKYAMGVIECGAQVNKKPVYTLLTSRIQAPALENSDYNLILAFTSARDMQEQIFNSLPAAANRFHEFWGLPAFRSLPLPIQEVKSIRGAAALLENNSGPAIARFMLPQRVSEIVAVHDTATAI